MLDFLTAQGLDGASVLEIGGGVGSLELELLRRGATRATNLELVDSYDDDAAALADEAGSSFLPVEVAEDRAARRPAEASATFSTVTLS